MSFLEQLPQDWSQPEFPQLRDLFVHAYRRVLAAEQLADQAGIAPGTFPFNYDNLRSLWTQLIMVMGDQGRLRRLVELAAADPAVEAFQQRFAEFLLNSPPIVVPAPPPAQGWWKGEPPNSPKARELFYERQLASRSRLIHIETARKVAELARSVAKLELTFAQQRAYGTGFLIDQNWLLTNHHNVVWPEYGALQSLVAEFDDERGFVGQPLARAGEIASIAGDAQHDWAAIRLAQPVDRAPIALGGLGQVSVGDHVIIIQHPHGALKQFALDTLSVRYADDQIIQYLADTQKGSSGSPVFDIKMQVIALHHSEAPSELNTPQGQQIEWRNEGIRIQQVIAGLQAQQIPFLAR